MSFSYNPSLGGDTDLVRFHIGDINADGFYLQDETIQYWVDQGSVGTAVIATLKFIITQLSSPDFKLDWLSVTNKEARMGFEKILKDKAQEFGIRLSGVTASATISLPYRADSDQYTSTTRETTERDNTSIYDGSP